MNFELIRSWLELPPGPWPPDHYTLLGLPVGQADVAIVEPRVLMRMELLRRHQLLQPDLVTEGMNRLAQALITLTDLTGKLAYDAQLGVSSLLVAHAVPAPAPLPESDPDPVIIAAPLLEDEPLEPEALHTHPTELTQEIVLPAELLVPYEVVPAPVVPLRKPVRPRPAERVVEAVPVVRPWPTPASSRRWIYSRLALIRKSIRAWNGLRPVLLDPQDPLDRPGRILLLLEGSLAIQPHLPSLRGVVGGTNEPGGLVAALVRQPLLLDTMRRLLPEQRQALARDWRLALVELEGEYHRLRQLAVEERKKAEGVPRVPAFVRWLRAAPELALAGFALFILFISLVRALLSRDSTLNGSP